MKSTKNVTLPCAIFGHNYIRSKTNIDYTVELKCKHCDIVVITDHEGNFDTNTVSNAQLKDALQKLYRLKLRSLKTKTL